MSDLMDSIFRRASIKRHHGTPAATATTPEPQWTSAPANLRVDVGATIRKVSNSSLYGRQAEEEEYDEGDGQHEGNEYEGEHLHGTQSCGGDLEGDARSMGIMANEDDNVKPEGQHDMGAASHETGIGSASRIHVKQPVNCWRCGSAYPGGRWYSNPDSTADGAVGTKLCGACFQYYRKYKEHRPAELIRRAIARSQAVAASTDRGKRQSGGNAEREDGDGDGEDPQQPAAKRVQKTKRNRTQSRVPSAPELNNRVIAEVQSGPGVDAAHQTSNEVSTPAAVNGHASNGFVTPKARTVEASTGFSSVRELVDTIRADMASLHNIMITSPDSRKILGGKAQRRIDLLANNLAHPLLYSYLDTETKITESSLSEIVKEELIVANLEGCLSEGNWREDAMD